MAKKSKKLETYKPLTFVADCAVVWHNNSNGNDVIMRVGSFEDMTAVCDHWNGTQRKPGEYYEVREIVSITVKPTY